MLKILLLIILISTLSVPIATSAQSPADSWPSRPVTLIVPVAAGGPSDNEGRVYAQKLTENLGQQFLIDFKPGGGSTIGMAYVVKAVADGHTLMLTASTLSVVPLMYKDLPYDPFKALAPVTLLSKRYALLVVHPSIPVKTLAEYVAYARAHPGELNFSTAGAGGAQHLTGVWLNTVTNTRTTLVHYKGTGSVMPDLLGGRAHVTFLTFTTALPLLKAGKMRALALANLERTPAMPDMPTMTELGYPDFEYSSWLGVLAPGPTPTAIVNRISAEFARAMKSPEIVQRFSAEGRLIGSTPEQFRSYIQSEHDRWKKLVRDNDIRFE